MGKTAYLDITFGASGDMILASFIDLGLPKEHLVSTLKKLPLPEFDLETKKVLKNGITALKLDITFPHDTDKKEHGHRNFKTIKEMINTSSLQEDIKGISIRTFEILADAEAKVHGKDRDDITFHEVGALDSIIDIVGIAVAISFFDITKAFHSSIPLCSGTVDTLHGRIPAMSPAAGILLEGRKFYRSGVEDELITPTAAAVIKILTNAENMPAGGVTDFSYESIGTGAGSKDFEGHPNTMRIFLGEAGDKEGSVMMIETNIDDMNPQLFDFLLESLFECKGVLDAFLVPVIMKKSRPGFLLKVLSDHAYLKEVTDIIFKNTTTIGIRFLDVSRIILNRAAEKITTKYGEFSVKVSKLEGRIVNASCEYEECKVAAKKQDLSVKEIMNHVNAKIQKKYL